MRLAGENTQEDPDVYQAIWKHLKSDGIPDQAANQMTAEMLTHGEDFESSVEKYQEAESIYKEKGFNEHAAQAMAVESMEDGEQPKKSLRYARLHTVKC